MMWDVQSHSITPGSRNDLESGCLSQAAKIKNTVFFALIIVLNYGHKQC